MAEFRVVIEGLELDDKTKRSINDDIQKVVLSHLADQDLTTKARHEGVIAFRPNPEWWGLIAQIIAHGELREIPAVERALEQFG